MRTSFRLRSVERFGRMSTSLKSSFVSCADETVGAPSPRVTSTAARAKPSARRRRE
jgi:hypothetical protein